MRIEQLRPALASRLAASALLGLGALLPAGCGDDPAGDPQADATPDVTPDAKADTHVDVSPDVDYGDAPDPGPDVQDDAVADVAPPTSCASDDDCADGLACTVDTCGEGGFCVWTLAPETCLVNHVCRPAGATRPGAPCEVCDPAAAPYAWTALAEGAACDDGDACTEATVCTAGACVGEAVTCQDDNVCTQDSCHPDVGCVFPPVEGELACDDGDVCTTGDTCLAGVCAGPAADCDDGNPCTTDTCDPALGCVHTDDDGATCEDGDPCTVDDTCAEGACVAGPPNPCDDDNACSIDLCDVDVGCVHLPTQNPCCIGLSSVCEDGNPCTTDLCDALTGDCDYVDNTDPCDDGDACTSDDVCGQGACQGAPVSCDDGNPCTADSCHPVQGCQHQPVSEVACDDGFECTTGDTCVAGQCLGDTSGCVCEPDFAPTAAKLNQVQLGESGQPGEALDLDQDPETCAPVDQCSGGVHNALGVLASLANEPLAEAVAEGSVVLVIEAKDLQQGPFTMAVYQADLAPESAGCDFQTTTCDYLVDAGMVDNVTCAPLVELPATLTGDQISAGGPGTLFPFSLPFQGSNLEITLYNVRFEGQVTLTDGLITGVTGIIGGAVPKTELVAAVEALPDDALPISKDAVLGLLDILVVNDIDTDGDGEADAASIGIKVGGIGANLVGIAP